MVTVPALPVTEPVMGLVKVLVPEKVFESARSVDEANVQLAVGEQALVRLAADPTPNAQCRMGERRMTACPSKNEV